MKHPILNDALAFKVTTRARDYYDEIEKAFESAVEHFRKDPTNDYWTDVARKHAATLRVLRYVLTGWSEETK